MNSINKHQIFSLMVIFEIGSTTLFALGIKAKKDAWLVILIAMFVGLGFNWIYTELQKHFPDKNYIEIIIAVLGKWIGIPLSLLYSVYWLWPAARNLREFGELIVITSLQNTPLPVIMFTFLLTSIYVLFLGVRVLGRTSEVTMPVIVFFIISVMVMLYLSGEAEVKNLLPVLQKGIKPVLKEVYPAVSLFPFGEIFVFSMFWCYVDDKNVVRKATNQATILTGILLSLISAMYIMVMGPDYTAIITIPFVEAVKMISIGQFFTNLDIIGISLIFLGGFYKMTLLFYGYVMVIATVFKIKKNKFLIVIMGIFLLWVAISFEPSYTYHRWMNPFDTNAFYIVFLHIIPALILLIYYFKRNKLKEKQQQ